MIKQLFSVATLMLFSLLSFGQDYTPKYKIIDNPNYPTKDMPVATYNVLDYGADPTGETDCTKIIQTLCDKISGKGTKSSERSNWQNISGGVLYLPEGIYKIEGQILVPTGVIIRGDWKAPEKDKPASGTIIKACPIQTDRESKSLFILYPCTCVRDLTIWYPEQDINDVKTYSPTFLFNKSGFWGSDYPGIRDITFINSYIGVKYNGGGCPNIFNVYGTPLCYGIQMDGIGDVGRFDGISFAPDYWANSGLAGAPSKEEIAAYTRTNTTGIRMMRNDWSYTCNYEAESMKIGFYTCAGADGYKPNGHHYNFQLKDCETGVLCEGSSYCGIMFTRVETDSKCDVGFRVNGGSDGPIQLYECNLNSMFTSFGIDEEAGATVQMEDCTVKGSTQVLSGQLLANSNTFKGDVTISPFARTIFTGNTVTGEFHNNSLYKCAVSEEKTEHRLMPQYSTEWMQPRTTKPAAEKLFVVTDEAYGCVPLCITDPLDEATDCSVAIQKALDDASAAGGGIVYLPPGHYRMDGNLTIPTGVELKGASDMPAVPHGQSAVLECFVGEGVEDGTPFISMAENSGLRGVCINYPNQTSPDAVKVYPYTIRGNKDTYIVNLGLRCAYRGVDLFTNKCDNHFVDYISGHAFKTVIRIGGGSEKGLVSNIQCNTGAYAYGHETKWGSWPNSDKSNSDAAFSQNKRDLDFMIIDDCDGEILYDNFLFGCNKGMDFERAENGKAARNVVSLGNAVDGAVNTFVFNDIDSDIDLTNSQIVALNEGSLNAYFITVGSGASDHNITFLSSDFWGSGKYLAKVASGNLNLYAPHTQESGTTTSFTISGNAKVYILNGKMRDIKKFVAASAQAANISIESTVVTATGVSSSSLGLNKNNLTDSWTMETSDIFAPRTNWTTSANNDANGTGSSKNAIDGKSTSRWSTNANQTPGQWFAVDFGEVISFNSLVLETMNSSSDGPAAYTVEIQGDDSDTWTQIAEGEDGSSMLLVSFDKVDARKIRINQNGSKTSNYWSIYEIYVGNLSLYTLDEYIETGVDNIYTKDNSRSLVEGVYDLQGRRLGDKSAWSSLKSGMYIMNGKTIIKK